MTGCSRWERATPSPLGTWRGGWAAWGRPSLQEPNGLDKDASHPAFGVWLFQCALRGRQVLPALVSGVDWAVRSTNRTAWAAAPPCGCPYLYGLPPHVGTQTPDGAMVFSSGGANEREHVFLRRFGLVCTVAQRR